VGICYPIAGWLGTKDNAFFYGSILGFGILATVQLLLSPKTNEHQHEYLWHDHKHIHDEHHQHDHPESLSLTEPHTHAHQHLPIRHRHAHYLDIHHLLRH
jgi:MFS transporter, NRE family, putaive nickel resistance protein